MRTILARVRTHAYTTLRGTYITNRVTGYRIQINRRGLDHTMHHGSDTPEGRRHVCALLALPALLEAAHPIAREANLYPRQAGSLVALHRFEASLQIQTEPFRVHLLVKEATDGFIFYDHRLSPLPR